MYRIAGAIAVLLAQAACSVRGGEPSAPGSGARTAPQPEAAGERRSTSRRREGDGSAARSEENPAAKEREESDVRGASGQAAAGTRRPRRLALQVPSWLADAVKPKPRILRLDRLEAVSEPHGTRRTHRREIEVTEEDLTPARLRWHGDLSLGIGTDDTWDSRVRLWTTIRDGVHLGLSAGVGRARWPHWHDRSGVLP